MTENEFKTEAKRIRQLMINTARQYLSDFDEADVRPFQSWKLWWLVGILRHCLNLYVKYSPCNIILYL